MAEPEIQIATESEADRVTRIERDVARLRLVILELGQALRDLIVETERLGRTVIALVEATTPTMLGNSDDPSPDPG